MSIYARTPCDEGVIRGGAPAPSRSRGAGSWVLAATILGSSMAFIDGSVVNVALPALQRDLGATGADAQWVIEAYTLFLASLILVGGSLGDRMGRRRIFAAGIALFTVASVWCGLAPSTALLIAARAVQGIGGALLVPSSLAIISATFDATTRGRAIGTWSGATAITSALGPLLGGWLVQTVSWRAVFFINVPLAAAVLVLVAIHMPESRAAENRAPLDWPGTLLVTLGLGSLVFGLISAGGQRLGDPLVLGALALGCLALAGFVTVEARQPAPMMPLSVFRSRTFAGANLLTFFLYAALGATLYYVPFDLQQVQGYSPAAAGAALLPFILIMSALSRWSGGLIRRYGARLPLVVGPLIGGVGFALFMRPGVGGSYWTTFFPAVVVLGIGQAIAVAPLTATVMGAVEARHAGIASGINNAVSRAAGLLAIAVLGILVAHTFDTRLSDRLATLRVPPAVRGAIMRQRDQLAAARPPAGLAPGLRAALRHAIGASFVEGFRLAAGAASLLALAAAVCALLLIRDEPTAAAARAPLAPPAQGQRAIRQQPAAQAPGGGMAG